jgi:hypothetical protein
MLISSNELMIINNGLFFLIAHLAITPWLYFCHYFVAGAKMKRKEKKRKRRKERRRFRVLGIHLLALFL